MAITDTEPRLTKDRAALVLFDVLQGYVHPKDPEKAKMMEEYGVVTHLTDLLNGARDAGLYVFYASANHSPDGSDVASRLTDTDMDLKPWPKNGVKTFRPALHRGDREAEVATELTPRENEIRIPKNRWSAFFQTALDLNLRTRGIQTIILAGLSTDVGIVSTAFSARDADFGIVFVRDACYAHRGPNHDFLMDRIFPRMGRVISTEQAVGLMKA
jgi:ureidoacrylate peracid hydrolase